MTPELFPGPPAPAGPCVASGKRQVEKAALEASMEDAAFTSEAVKRPPSRCTSRSSRRGRRGDRAALATLVGPDLMVEWSRRLDDFDRKGWHNITERLGDPTVEYLGLVNREGDQDDRVTVRIEAPIRDYTLDATGERLLRTDDTDEHDHAAGVLDARPTRRRQLVPGLDRAGRRGRSRPASRTSSPAPTPTSPASATRRSPRSPSSVTSPTSR